jgi:molybdenum cofactor cytidylyltransferase
VGFGPPLRGELLRLSGDIGARSLLTRYAHRLRLLDSDDPGILADIDTPGDLHAWKHSFAIRR